MVKLVRRARVDVVGYELHSYVQRCIVDCQTFWTLHTFPRNLHLSCSLSGLLDSTLGWTPFGHALHSDEHHSAAAQTPGAASS